MHAIKKEAFPAPAGETSLCTCKKGSMTLEAVVVFPFITAFFVSILFFFRILQIETEIQTALVYASRKVAAEASVVEHEAILNASAKAYLTNALKDAKQVKGFVDAGAFGVSLLRSDCSGENIKLVADYRITLPFHLFPNLGFKIRQSQVSKKWTGDGEGASDGSDEYVYVTKEGSAYHSTTKCKYLDLSIHGVKFAEIQGLRNEDDKKYYPCSACAEKNTQNEMVYITNYGGVYHMNINCVGLRRTIYMIRLSEIGEKTRCPKCF